MKILMLTAPYLLLSLSADSEEDRFRGAEVPAREITTSPGSFQADISSAEVRIIPTEFIPEDTSARTKEKGKYSLH